MGYECENRCGYSSSHFEERDRHEDACVHPEVVARVEAMTHTQRAAFLEWFRDRWCRHCGSSANPCHCENDE